MVPWRAWTYLWSLRIRLAHARSKTLISGFTTIGMRIARLSCFHFSWALVLAHCLAAWIVLETTRTHLYVFAESVPWAAPGATALWRSREKQTCLARTVVALGRAGGELRVPDPSFFHSQSTEAAWPKKSNALGRTLNGLLRFQVEANTGGGRSTEVMTTLYNA